MTYRRDRTNCGELASKTFFIRPGLPKRGWFQRINELADTAPNPRDQRVGRSELVVVFWMANRRRIDTAMTAVAQLFILFSLNTDSPCLFDLFFLFSWEKKKNVK